ncbi:MAG TPA: tyrosine-type recombinase/integrase [Pyrinomonadaceae bacterium]|nr:tyrosine-type recombinase/integrase [Pyrinomonadaceae bacterium]
MKFEGKKGEQFFRSSFVQTRMSQTFNLAIRDRVTRENPCLLVSKSILADFPRWIPRERWLNKYDPEEEQKLFSELSPQLVPLCRLVLHTGVRPPKEILLAEKAHVNLSSRSIRYRFTERDGEHLVGQSILIPPRALLVVHGKDNTVRVVPLNDVAYGIMEVLCGDMTTGDWLFTNREGEPIETFKKGFAAACARAGLDDLRPYDLRHTFATRLQERYVHQYTISELLGHSQPVGGFGQASRITPKYSHTTWEAMRRAVESLEYEPSEIIVFGNVSRGDSDKIQTNRPENEAMEDKAKAS